MQGILIAMGHDLGPTGADGRMGPYTARALRIESNVHRCERTTPDLLRALQAVLITLDYDLGPTDADGIRGPYTRRALRDAAGIWGAPPIRDRATHIVIERGGDSVTVRVGPHAEPEPSVIV